MNIVLPYTGSSQSRQINVAEKPKALRHRMEQLWEHLWKTPPQATELWQAMQTWGEDP